MLSKKFWIPVVLILIGVVIGTVFWGQRLDSQEPVKVYKPVEVTEIAQPKPPPPGETYETGHWHGDEWHAEPHEPVVEADAPPERFIDAELAAYEASLSHYTEEERATYDRALRGEIIRHREKYPNCQDHEAAFKDADRFSRWYVKWKEHKKIEKAALAEWKAVTQEYLNWPDYNEMMRMTDSEKQALIEKVLDSDQRADAASKHYNELRQKEPVQPKPSHTHSIPVQELSSGNVQGEESIDAEIIEQAKQEGNIRLFDKRTQEYHDAVKAWQEWHKKADEIRVLDMQAGQMLINALPTEEEAKRYENDEQFKREMGRKVNEAGKRIGEVIRMREEHAAKKPPFPYIQ